MNIVHRLAQDNSEVETLEAAEGREHPFRKSSGHRENRLAHHGNDQGREREKVSQGPPGLIRLKLFMLLLRRYLRLQL